MYSTVAEFQAVHKAAEGNAALAGDCLGLAADWVQNFAPEPSEPAEEYFDRAARAERAVGAHLYNTYGGISSKGIGDLSKSYTDGEKIRALVKQSMGRYYKAARIRSVPATRG